MKLGSRQHIVLSTEKVANDLLRERGNYYSSREQTIMAPELLSHGLRPLLLPYNGRKLVFAVYYDTDALQTVGVEVAS